MKQTVLHPFHEQSKAKMTDYQGWQIPLQFSDVAEEHHAVRSAAGLFDIGYLGVIEVSGAQASAFLQKIVTRNISKIPEGTAHYGLICNDAGFILDDVFIIRPEAAGAAVRFLLSTNPGNTEKIFRWLSEHAAGGVEIRDRSSASARMSLQGPRSSRVLELLAGEHFKKLKPRTVRTMTLAGADVLVSRSGFTGEHGYEFMVPAESARAFWKAVLEKGSDLGILPCGFACRDVLRMEMGYLLYGNDIDESRTPIEAGLGQFVDFKKDFIGKDALLKLKKEGTRQKLAGFVLLDKGVPKSGGSIFSENREIGTVTSGVQSPYVRKGIGLGYVVSRYAQANQEIEIEVRDREIAAKIVDLPFYRKK